MRKEDEAFADYCDGRMTNTEKEAFERRLTDDRALARRLKLWRAMKRALASSLPPMPSDLKEALRGEARTRSWRRQGRHASFHVPVWAGLGLGAAFALTVFTVIKTTGAAQAVADAGRTMLLAKEDMARVADFMMRRPR